MNSRPKHSAVTSLSIGRELVFKKKRLMSRTNNKLATSSFCFHTFENRYVYLDGFSL